jgi:hypothetical protein
MYNSCRYPGIKSKAQGEHHLCVTEHVPLWNGLSLHSLNAKAGEKPPYGSRLEFGGIAGIIRAQNAGSSRLRLTLAMNVLALIYWVAAIPWGISLTAPDS